VIRIASVATVLGLVAVSTVHAIAGARSHQGAATGPRALGQGVYLSIDESHVERAPATEGLIETQVTLSNQGARPLRIDYLTFSLSDAAGARSLALLPSELSGQVAPPLLLREGVLASGQTVAAVVYFRSPSPHFRPFDLRVDLATADGQVASRSFVPLALN
jgi:hypothetical protein